MGSGGSKKTPDASNNAGPESSNQSTKEEGSSLPPINPPKSTEEHTQQGTSSVTKLPEVTKSSENQTNETKKSNDKKPDSKDIVIGNSSSTKEVEKAVEKPTNSNKAQEKTTNSSKTMDKGNNSTKTQEKGDNSLVDEFVEPEDQRKFDEAVCSACVLVKPESLMKKITKNVTKLQLSRALPWNYNFYDILCKFSNLEEIDIANNNIGPNGFRSICLAMCNNGTITSLNVADNMADTDSSESIGRMLTQNKTLVYLNVSSNNLGKDYFSRCVGPALKVNTTLQTLRAQSIGSTDMKMLMEGLKENMTLTDVDLSNNPLSDRTIMGKGFGEKLKDPNCSLKSISLASCEINSAGIEGFLEGLESNTSLEELNLNGNEFESLKRLGRLVTMAMNSACMSNLCLDSIRIKDKNISASDIKVELKTDTPSQLKTLSINDSSLTDTFWTSIEEVIQGKQIPLLDVNIGSNTDLSPKCLESILKISADSEGVSPIQRINYSLNTQCSGLSEKLSTFTNLQYVNVRRARIRDAHQMAVLYTTGNLTTLVLDNLKLASTDTLNVMMENVIGSSLRTLSLGGCSLSAADIAPLCQAIKKGYQLHMLKLSANRLEDEGVTDLSQALISCKTHPLAVLDLSSNAFTDAGAQSLSKIFSTKSHKSQLHSLNVTANNIDLSGIMSLVSCVGGKSPLHTLHIQNQKDGLQEDEITEVFKKLAAGLGFNIKKLETGSSDLPNLPEGLLVNLSSLGGNPGPLGALLDSLRILTDYTNDRIPTMTFGHVQELCAWIKNSGGNACIWSAEEWGIINGSNRPSSDTPSWVQLGDSRSKALYISNLPGNTTQQKMDAMFEMEADCNLDEVCLMKDPVTRSINGTGWVLMSDQESVKKAVDYFLAGEAKVFGQPIKISRINIKVDDEANSQAEAKAREDHELRQKQKQQEAQAYRSLIQRTTEESWKRHAYRLAHPAYADGRIW